MALQDLLAAYSYRNVTLEGTLLMLYRHLANGPIQVCAPAGRPSDALQGRRQALRSSWRHEPCARQHVLGGRAAAGTVGLGTKSPDKCSRPPCKRSPLLASE